MLLAWFRRAFVALAVGWGALVPLAPLLAVHREWASSTLAYGVAAGAYAIGSLVCHQRPERSFHLLGVALPVCARCTGIYLGAAVTSIGVTCRGVVRRMQGRGRLASAEVSSALAPDVARAVLVWAMLPTMGTLVFEWVTGRMPSHATRALTGAALGAAVAWIVNASRPGAAERM